MAAVAGTRRGTTCMMRMATQHHSSSRHRMARTVSPHRLDIRHRGRLATIIMGRGTMIRTTGSRPQATHRTPATLHQVGATRPRRAILRPAPTIRRHSMADTRRLLAVAAPLATRRHRGTHHRAKALLVTPMPRVTVDIMGPMPHRRHMDSLLQAMGMGRLLQVVAMARHLPDTHLTQEEGALRRGGNVPEEDQTTSEEKKVTGKGKSERGSREKMAARLGARRVATASRCEGRRRATPATRSRASSIGCTTVANGRRSGSRALTRLAARRRRRTSPFWLWTMPS
mmetsp:Transcript_80113/g.258954  ORF Transcript_80113/g.258954 Transcript_80113/m.258954 type:complete len:285 (-) Transcript_80113:932-1786(-)